MDNFRSPPEATKSTNSTIPASVEHKIDTSKELEQRPNVDEKEVLQKQNFEKDRVRKQITQVCSDLNLDNAKDIADISVIPKLCQLLKELAVLSELKLDTEITESPEDFSCLLKLLKKHHYGYCNITTCCEILKSFLDVSGSPYSTQSQAEVLKELSNLWITKASYNEAITAAEHLAKLANVLGDKKLEGEAYYILVKPYALKGSIERAKQALEKCVQCSEESGDELTIGFSKQAKAIIHYLGQEYDKALVEEKQFLEIAQQLKNQLAECEATLQMATVYCGLFKIQEGLNLFSKGLKMAKVLEWQQRVVKAQVNISAVYALIGDYRKAYKIVSEIASTLHTCEDKRFVFGVLCNYSAYALLNDRVSNKKSLELAWESLVIAEQMGTEREIALAHGNIGLAQEKLGHIDEAVASFEKCLELGEKIKDNRIINNSYCNLGRAYEGKGDKESRGEARKFYLKTLDMCGLPSSHWGDTEDFRFSADYLLGKMDLGENNLQKAKGYFEQVVERCEKFRKSVQDSPLKICFNDTQKKPFQYLQHILLRQEAVAEALLVGERGRGRDFYDKVIKEDKSKQFSSPESLLQLAKANKQAVLFLSKLDVVQEMRVWFISPDGEIVNAFRQPLHQWDKLLEDWLMVFSQSLMGPTNNVQASEVPIGNNDQASEVLIGNKGAEMVEKVTEFRGMKMKYAIDDESDDSDDEFGVVATTEKMERGAGHPHSAISQDSTKFSNLIDKLSELIVRPIESHLEKLASEEGVKPQLLIIPQGQTFNIPYPVLRLKNGEPLCSLVSPFEAFSFYSYSYSMSLQQEAKSQHYKMEDVLIVGNPTNDLQFSQKEAETIANKLGVTPLMKSFATRLEVLRRISKAPIIHFACHGSVDGRCLFLAPDQDKGKDEKTDIDVEDIANLSLQANLVVLSACHTARGKISSEGVLGLARAFIMAGAKSVITALWAVNDSATEKFMLKFYNNLHSEPVVNALASTMCEMKKENYHDVRWGSFKILGANVRVFSN